MALLCPTEELQKYYHLYHVHHVPDFPTTDPLTAMAVGIVSGLAATDADQIIKRASK